MSTPLLIIGAGGFALEAIWLAEAMNTVKSADWHLVGLADDSVSAGETIGGLPVLGTPDVAAQQLPSGTAFHIAIGDNRVRLRLADELIALGLTPASLISPKAEIASDAQIGLGSFIGHFASIAPQTVIGAQALINVSAVVGHEAIIGDGAQLCPGVVVTGRCRVGRGAFLGSNAVLQPGVSIGDYALVSANTFAASDVESGVTLATMPGRPVFSRKRRDEKPRA
ncbi:acetyltransferase [Cerasicoccus arenae]|uniref:Transferase n=1 Tax=Cerasicoccus arenae TaxID=424488 RepID=A0A8J3DD02_9BACT|nr:acetyltransferase [Cerasicoccus arenae]MBK1858662.1 acetyltransferase [Cerasicoccus arenae]GHC04735.1 transferase [Cerasicoccus arenae]